MVEALPGRPKLPLRIAISDCLLGRNVRFDGGSARSSFPHTLLNGVFEYHGVCPEVGIGMGTPRDAIRLVGDVHEPRVVGVTDPLLDVTDALKAYGESCASSLDDVVGYVFMKNSPSCGLFSVKVYPHRDMDASGRPLARGRGAHARAVIAARPSLPVEENARLNDPMLRERFVTRVFTYAHLQMCFSEPRYLSAMRLAAFHEQYRYLLMAHSVDHYRRAEQVLADRGKDLAQRLAAYSAVLLEGLGTAATRQGHANVLLRLQGYCEEHLMGPSRRQLDALISGYRRGEQSLSAPLALIARQLSRKPEVLAKVQAYLEPHPGYQGFRG